MPAARAARILLLPMRPTIAELREQHTQLVAYLLTKVKAEDWHAVQDAASDIREIVAQIKVLDQC